MSAAAQSWTFGATAALITSAWNGTTTLAVTSAGTATGTVSFAGQAYAGLNGPLQGWPDGAAS